MAAELDYLGDSEFTLVGTSVSLSSMFTDSATKGTTGINARLKKIAFVPASGVTVNITSSSSVSAASCPVPSSGHVHWMNATSATSIKLFGTGRLSVYQYG